MENYILNHATYNLIAQINALLMVVVFMVVATILTVFVVNNRYKKLQREYEQRVNKSKDELLSIASHQLRTPATGVKQYLGLILDGYSGNISSNQKKIIEKAYMSNERQLKTINDVLYLARLDYGRTIVSKNRVDLNEQVRDIVEELRSEIKEKKHTVTLKPAKSQPVIITDKHMIRMAIENLITNAIKYTKPGGKIKISVKDAGDEKLISVSDNGVGITKEQMDLLFQQFSRLPNELTRSTNGTGIGLYLTKHIIELQGGHIEVQSEKGKGSTFTIHI